MICNSGFCMFSASSFFYSRRSRRLQSFGLLAVFGVCCWGFDLTFCPGVAWVGPDFWNLVAFV